jgi:hypothetical protein
MLLYMKYRKALQHGKNAWMIHDIFLSWFNEDCAGRKELPVFTKLDQKALLLLLN